MEEPVLLVLDFAREVTQMEKASLRKDDPDEPFGSVSPDYTRNLQKIYSAYLTTHERNCMFELHDPPLFQGVTEADA